MVEKINWNCKICGEFKWFFLKEPKTKKEKESAKAYGIDVVLAIPKTKEDWLEAELYDLSEPYEPIRVSESDKDYCKKCIKRIKELEGGVEN